MSPYWNDLVLFYEYFHGDNGRGLGATHQTGWTALVCNCLFKIANHRKQSLTILNGPKTVAFIHSNMSSVDPSVWTEEDTFSCYEIQALRKKYAFPDTCSMMVELFSKCPWVYISLLNTFAKSKDLDHDICLIPKFQWST